MKATKWPCSVAPEKVFRQLADIEGKEKASGNFRPAVALSDSIVREGHAVLRQGLTQKNIFKTLLAARQLQQPATHQQNAPP
jgi:hypothetical protein